MKGIILAGGAGTRLYPSTKTISKQLLPVYDKPMIYYPLATQMQFGIKDLLIISTPQDTPNIEKLFGDGSDFGLSISYKVQAEPKGIAQAFTIGAEFVGKDPVSLILGDNIFHMGDSQIQNFKEQINKNKNNSTIFAIEVTDPQRFGVIEFDENKKAISIEEKPTKPKSNYASVGLYYYPGDVVSKVKTLKPSARGELEITGLNNIYLQESRLDVVAMDSNVTWMDAGTFDSLNDSSNYVRKFWERTNKQMACVEEIAFKQGFIGNRQMENLIEKYPNCPHRDYLIKVYSENKK